MGKVNVEFVTFCKQVLDWSLEVQVLVAVDDAVAVASRATTAFGTAIPKNWSTGPSSGTKTLRTLGPRNLYAPSKTSPNT
jgi:hypothetical protein